MRTHLLATVESDRFYKTQISNFALKKIFHWNIERSHLESINAVTRQKVYFKMAPNKSHIWYELRFVSILCFISYWIIIAVYNNFHLWICQFYGCPHDSHANVSDKSVNMAIEMLAACINKWTWHKTR